MVGAGCSVPLSYPAWDRLIEDIHRTLASSVPDKAGGVDDLDYADTLKDHILAGDNGTDDYHRYLSDTFSKKISRQFDALHEYLVRLGFVAVITTNYDPCLEEAITNWKRRICHDLDLSKPRVREVFLFLRSLSEGLPQRESVLHLHGGWRNPGEIILSRKDFEARYGWKMGEDDVATSQGEPGDTYKVLWTLSAMYHFLFVGFSMNDIYFRETLKRVQKGFRTGTQIAHYALVSYRDDDDLQRSKSEWQSQGICPIFYNAPLRPDGSASSDHSALTTLVLELGRLSGDDLSLGGATAFTDSTTEL